MIILNYNSYEDTLECIDSLYRSLDINNLQILVIDNASTNNSYEILKEKLPSEVTLLKSEHNRGYANGNNIGIKYAVEQGAEYICILNNDVIAEEDFLTPCIEALKDLKTGFVSPRIMDYKTGLIQNTGGMIDIRKGYDIKINPDQEYTDEIPPVIECDVVYGSCLLLRTDLLDQIGLIPEDYFLFYEETDWCYHAHTLGYVNKSITTVCVRHKGGASTDHFAGTGLLPYLYDRNRIVFTKKYLNKLQMTEFAVSDFFKTIYQERKRPRKLLRRLSRKYDGLRGKVNRKYSYIYVNRQKS